MVSGWMKRLIGSVWREADSATFQQRAIKKAEKIEHGEKVLAPKHPTDERVFREAQCNAQIREELDTKHENLVNQVNQIKISASTPPPTTPPPDKESLRTHNSAFDTSRFEYGVYELPAERMMKNHLSLREALEILRARMQVDAESGVNADPEHSSSEYLRDHPAMRRVDAARLDNMYRYFRPFVHQEQQRVVLRTMMDGVRQVAEGKSDYAEIVGNPMTLLKEMLKAKKFDQTSLDGVREHQMLDIQDEETVKQIKSRRDEEFQQLQQQMKEFYLLDEEMRSEKQQLQGDPTASSAKAPSDSSLREAADTTKSDESKKDAA